MAVVERQVCVDSIFPIRTGYHRDKLLYAESWEHGGPLLDQYEVIIGRGQETAYDVVREFLSDELRPGQRRNSKYATARLIDSEVQYRGDTAMEAGMRAIVGGVYGPNVPDLVPDGKGNEMAPEALHAA